MNPPGFERLTPGEYVLVHTVDECAVEIEQKSLLCRCVGGHVLNATNRSSFAGHGAFDRARRQLRRHIREVLLSRLWTTRFAVIHCKRTKHFSFARHDWRGPASSHID